MCFWKWLVILDNGLVQVDLVRGDTKERGVKWNDYDRAISWGCKQLDLAGPRSLNCWLSSACHRDALVGAPCYRSRIFCLVGAQMLNVRSICTVLLLCAATPAMGDKPDFATYPPLPGEHV